MYIFSPVLSPSLLIQIKLWRLINVSYFHMKNYDWQLELTILYFVILVIVPWVTQLSIDIHPHPCHPKLLLKSAISLGNRKALMKFLTCRYKLLFFKLNRIFHTRLFTKLMLLLFGNVNVIDDTSFKKQIYYWAVNLLNLEQVLMKLFLLI